MGFALRKLAFRSGNSAGRNEATAAIKPNTKHVAMIKKDKPMVKSYFPDLASKLSLTAQSVQFMRHAARQLPSIPLSDCIN